jgi:hypothetical protein
MAGAPKLGKSWLAHGLAIAVASGGYALGKVPVVQGDVLYLALEDNARRLQDRLRILLNGNQAPDGFHLELEWPRLDAGGAERLDDWLSAHRDARLVLVDVYPRIRPQSKNRDQYQTDYEGAAQLQALAITHGVAVVALYHTRKAEAVDFVETVQGTFGIAGAADTIVVVKRARGEADATLHITGRDVVEQELALQFVATAGTWELLGPAAEHDLHETRKTIREAVAAHGRLTPKRISELTSISHDLAKVTTWRMANDGQLAAANGFYSIPVTAVTETPEVAWLSDEERLQVDAEPVTEETDSVTELQRLQGSRGSVTAPADTARERREVEAPTPSKLRLLHEQCVVCDRDYVYDHKHPEALRCPACRTWVPV